MLQGSAEDRLIGPTIRSHITRGVSITRQKAREQTSKSPNHRTPITAESAEHAERYKYRFFAMCPSAVSAISAVGGVPKDALRGTPARRSPPSADEAISTFDYLYQCTLGGISEGLPFKVVIILASTPVAFMALIPPSIYDLENSISFGQCRFSCDSFLRWKVPVQ